MTPEHITVGRKRWMLNVKKAIDERCICKAKMAKKIGVSTVLLNGITSYVRYPSFKNFNKINDFLELKEQRYFYYRKKRSDARK
jgi:ribosome-binding protein aMBF1 (putative translation factor)